MNISLLARQFPVAIPESNFDSLKEELLDYTLVQSELLPSLPREEGKSTKSEDPCSYWTDIRKMKTLGCGPIRMLMNDFSV